MIIICDSSPLIALAHIDQLNLPDALFSEVIIPEAVYKEISITTKPFASVLSNWCHNKIRKPENLDTVATFSSILGEGESEAFVLYQETCADLVLLDDAKARRIANKEGIRFIGTLGMLAVAKRHGLLIEIKPMLLNLREAGMWITDEILLEILQDVGENL